MIFVTVGTHEQPFNRLVEYIDRWAGEHDEEVVIQLGFTRIEPENCKWQPFYSHDDMIDMIRKARVVVTHGGPCCYMEVLRMGKIPVVVPRNSKLGEHVDDHQIKICREYIKHYNNLLLVEDIEKLGECLSSYDDLTRNMDAKDLMSNNLAFCEKMSGLIGRLFQ